MSRDNKSKYAIMGILNMRPMSGYSIKKTIEQGLTNFWSESYGQIYPILRSLVTDGLATTTTEEQTGKPNRNIYALTDAGRADLLQWLARPIDYDPGRIEILLKLYFGTQVPIEQSLGHVEQHLQTHQSLLARYAEIEQWLSATYPNDPGLPYWLMTVSYGKHITQALANWSIETLTTLESLKSVSQLPAPPTKEPTNE